MADIPRSPLIRTLTWLFFGVLVGLVVAVVRYLLGEQQSALSIVFTLLIPTVAAGIAAGIKSSQK